MSQGLTIGIDPGKTGGIAFLKGEALAYAGPITLTDNAHVMARAKLDEWWSPLCEAQFAVKGSPASASKTPSSAPAASTLAG